MRLGHITGSAPKPSQFTVLIRAIPWHPERSYGDTLRKYFTNYYSSRFLSHQMVYHNGIIQRLLVRLLLGPLCLSGFKIILDCSFLLVYVFRYNTCFRNSVIALCEYNLKILLALCVSSSFGIQLG